MGTMNFFTFQFLGVAMLIVCTFAAPLSEERRGENVFKCDTDGYMSSGGHKLKCGRGLDSGPYEMQRGWHPTGKLLGNVIGGVVGKLREGDNLMQNANGQEKRQGENLMQNANGQEKRQGEQTNEMQNGGEGEEERE